MIGLTGRETRRRAKRRPVAGALLVAMIAASCGSTDPGVSIGQARQSGSASVGGSKGPDTPATATSGPAGTEPPDTSIPDTGTPDTSIPDTVSPDTVSPDTVFEPPISSPGSSGVGDELFPDLGNPGIDVNHYDIDLRYDPHSTAIDATVSMSITATAALASFTLDQVGLDVADVSVDGAAAEFSEVDPELLVRPSSPIADGAEFEVIIAYSTTATSIGVVPGLSAGWFSTELGSFVLNEPDGARTWLPSNDHPSDKATYRFALHLPDGYTGIANGDLQSSDPDTGTAGAGGRVWVWNQTEPMTTYVIQVVTGPFTIIEQTAPSGLALTHAVLTKDRDLMQPFIDVTPKQIDFFDDFFGPYPFDSYGIAMTDGDIGAAMEEQGRSLFSRADFASGELGFTEQLLLAHELTHQWFGDAVSPARWQDIWLNESFATYGEWMWLEHAGLLDLAETARSNLEQRQNGTVATGRPGRETLFGYDVYEGGAVVVQALRLTIGDAAFFQLLKRWIADNIDTSRTTDDFIALAEAVAGRDLTKFFADWLYAADLPNSFPG